MFFQSLLCFQGQWRPLESKGGGGERLRVRDFLNTESVLLTREPLYFSLEKMTAIVILL